MNLFVIDALYHYAKRRLKGILKKNVLLANSRQ